LAGNIGKAIACFRALGFAPDMDSFQDRLMAQKIVFLLELKGVKMDFGYGMYVHGPYSRFLAGELYANRQETKTLKTGEKLTAQEADAVSEMKAVFSLDPAILEIASTYAFYAYKERLPAWEAHRRTRELKGSLPSAKITLGINRAKEFLFVPTERELREMREEFAPWQSASSIKGADNG